MALLYTLVKLWSHSSKDQGCLLGKWSIVLAILFARLSTRDDPISSSNRTIQASNASLHFLLNIGRHFNPEISVSCCVSSQFQSFLCFRDFFCRIYLQDVAV